jgi:hypothetical protein
MRTLLSWIRIRIQTTNPYPWTINTATYSHQYKKKILRWHTVYVRLKTVSRIRITDVHLKVDGNEK